MKILTRPEQTQLQACNIENVIPSAIGNVELVKLLHSPSVTKLTIEYPIFNIFNYKGTLTQNNCTTKIDQNL